MSDLVVRPASKDEFAIAIQWATQEGWNPGLDDLEAFHLADPDGFLMGWLGNVAVSSISVVRYGEDFGFLGFYIVHPDYRGRGVGLSTWNAGLAHLGDRTVALDGVVDQQSNYRKSGFDYVARNVRYAGKSASFQPMPLDRSTRPVEQSDLPALLKLDLQCFAAKRQAFISNWCLPTRSRSRTTHVIETEGNLVGFGTIRQCREGFKIGPLFAATVEGASRLLRSLAAATNPQNTIILDVPETNVAAVKLANDNGFSPVFETARMVRGAPPGIPWDRVFGITSFELG